MANGGGPAGGPPYLPETVVFVIDVQDDLEVDAARYAARLDRLELLKQGVAMFAQLKSRVNSLHKYGLAVVQDTGVHWEGPGVSTSPDALAATLRAMAQPPPPPPGGRPPPPPLELGSLVGLLAPLRVAEEADGAKLRVVLLYGRSTVLPTWTTHKADGLAMDVLFLHDKAAAAAVAGAAVGPQDVYTWLEDNVDVLAGRDSHSAYIFESGGHLAKKVVNHLISLTAHPAQRPPQRSLRAAPLDLAAMPMQATSAAAAAAPDAAAFPALVGTGGTAAAPAPLPPPAAGAWAAGAAAQRPPPSLPQQLQQQQAAGRPGSSSNVPAVAPPPLPVQQRPPPPPPVGNLIDLAEPSASPSGVSATAGGLSGLSLGATAVTAPPPYPPPAVGAAAAGWDAPPPVAAAVTTSPATWPGGAASGGAAFPGPWPDGAAAVTAAGRQASGGDATGSSPLPSRYLPPALQSAGVLHGSGVGAAAYLPPQPPGVPALAAQVPPTGALGASVAWPPAPYSPLGQAVPPPPFHGQPPL